VDHDDREKYRLAYDEATRALAYQRAAIDALRTRVGYLVSAATIATSFLGGLALRTEADIGSWVAILLFVAFGLVAAKVLWPRAEGAEGFTARPSVLIEAFEAPNPDDLERVYRDLALYAEEAHDYNTEKHLKPLTDWFRAATFLLVAEIAAWVIALALR
jgi:hypothetical protein